MFSKAQTGYVVRKELLLQRMIERKTEKQIAEEFKVTPMTIIRWKRKLFDERAGITKVQREELMREFVTTANEELDIARRSAMEDIKSKKETVRRGAAQTLVLVISKQMELYGRLGILPTEVQNVRMEQVRTLDEALVVDMEKLGAKKSEVMKAYNTYKEGKTKGVGMNGK